MARIFKWGFMLSKRLYKKPSFVVLLVLIPICMFAFSIAANQDGGFVHIVLAQKNSSDSVSTEIIDELLSTKSIVQFTEADTPDTAIENVKNGLADEAWIFPDNTESEIEGFVTGRSDYVVSVVTKEQSVSLRLARDKLVGELYKYCAKAFYIDYIRTNISDLDDLSDRELITYFEEVRVDETLFVYGNPADISANDDEANYLTSPIRGLLAVLMVICGMAATLYYMQDEESGTFARVKQRRKGIAALGCVLTAIVNVSVVVLLSLCLSRLAGNIFKEIFSMLLYAFCCASFCLCLRQIFASIRSYAAIIPLLAVVLIGVCPIFFEFRGMSELQMIFPPTYYVKAVYDGSYLIYMIGYSVAGFLLSFGLQEVKKVVKN